MHVLIKYCNWKNLHAHEIRRQALQPRSPQSRDKGPLSSDQGHAVCWWRSCHGCFTDGPLLKDVQGIWANHQPEKDERPWKENRGSIGCHHWRLLTYRLVIASRQASYRAYTNPGTQSKAHLVSDLEVKISGWLVKAQRITSRAAATGSCIFGYSVYALACAPIS